MRRPQEQEACAPVRLPLTLALTLTAHPMLSEGVGLILCPLPAGQRSRSHACGRFTKESNRPDSSLNLDTAAGAFQPRQDHALNGICCLSSNLSVFPSAAPSPAADILS